ncbi:YkgJ family cysteine cluster protein [Candidatus Bathyarchaeota archaeon A05DMB-2]|jgi:Fe-S-cluster containining protein|nr:YkgJ family cysteine cluster protein [Candidatus Bathyarchaeota archaeon A05DMB-2]
MSESIAEKTCAFHICCACKGTCCRDAKPPLTESRQKIIMGYLEKQKIHIEAPFSHERYSYPAVDNLGFCVFYDKSASKCMVHPVKPETCRAGPITFDINPQTGKVEWYLKKSEICAFAEVLYSDYASFKQHLEVAKTEILRLICELDAEALQAILEIEEPQTFKVGEDILSQEVLANLRCYNPYVRFSTD